MPLKKKWELEAEKMLERNQLLKGRIITPASKERYAKKAYRLLMITYEQSYCAVSDKEAAPDHQSRRIRQTQKAIREHCRREALEALQGAVSVRDHRKVIAGLEARVREHREGLAAAVKDAFRERAIEAAGSLEEYEIEQIKADLRGPGRVKAVKPTARDIDKEIRRLKGHVTRYETSHGLRRRSLSDGAA